MQGVSPSYRMLHKDFKTNELAFVYPVVNSCKVLITQAMFCGMLVKISK